MRSTTKVETVDSGSHSFLCNTESNCEVPSTETVSYGLESIEYIGPHILKLIHDKLKELEQEVKSLKLRLQT